MKRTEIAAVKVRRMRRCSEKPGFPRCGGSAAVAAVNPHTPYRAKSPDWLIRACPFSISAGPLRNPLQTVIRLERSSLPPTRVDHHALRRNCET
jgi:hypothetical protein